MWLGNEEPPLACMYSLSLFLSFKGLLLCLKILKKHFFLFPCLKCLSFVRILSSLKTYFRRYNLFKNLFWQSYSYIPLCFTTYFVTYPKTSVQQIFIEHLLCARYTNPLYFEFIHVFRYTDLGAVVVWMFVSSTKNSCVENLTSKVMVWRGGAFARYLGHEDGALKKGITLL